MSKEKYHALLFEAKSIQQYLLESGRLRDIIGASELVDALTGSILDQALSALALQEGRDLQFSRRAGGAFYALSASRRSLEKLLSLFSLLVQQQAPELAYDVGLGSGVTPLQAFDVARRALHRDGNRIRPRLPLSAPIARRNPRTGRTVEDEDRTGLTDAATAAKKHCADLSRAGFIHRFSPEQAELGWRDWPRNMDAEEGETEGVFPFIGENRGIALLHADGNGLGQLLLRAGEVVGEKPEHFVDVFRTLSNVLADSMVEAARQATEEVLLPARSGDQPLPARPILLGGDDLTILLRADLAMSFLQVFVKAFEEKSPLALRKLKDMGVTGLPERLTIGAGLVFMGASQPFYLASHLAEGLMAEAKHQAKLLNPAQPPSSVVFYRVTSSLVDDYSAIVKNELTHEEDGAHYIDTLGCYFLGAGKQSPRLEDLLKLEAMLSSEVFARGPTRQLLTLMGLSLADARTRYKRWRQLMKEHRPNALDNFNLVMERLLSGPLLDDLPYGKAQDGDKCSPLGDALALMGVAPYFPDTVEEEKVA